MKLPENEAPPLDGVAIIGMSGQFPGARNVGEFWANQRNGIEAISHFGVEDLEIPNAAAIAEKSNYVRARSILADVDLFDAEFFGIYPREAELMDPQQRLFLEACWNAFEDAGYDPAACAGAVGVYAGSSTSTYFLSRLCARPDFIRQFTSGYQVDNYLEMMGNNLDFLSTRVSYKLNLRGPSFTMQAGCSTSLLAVCQACQSLLTFQSDMALAGGVSITFPQKRGSFYQEGGMVSLDGHCRTFDEDAGGTVFGSGVAVLLLKRLEDAMRDGDQIYAVIRGFAINNDGAARVGYTAPSVEGQARVIAMAQEAAGVAPETIGYIEAHGTATPLGDPIELAALTQAFRARTDKKQFCVVGTAKTNVGHLDIAAGVTGLIHATQIVRHGLLPATLHFKRPNPKFNLEASPFHVNTKLSTWKSDGTPRRAGVSAFGVGGTNAHVVIEQAPAGDLAEASRRSARPKRLLVLSARSEGALDHAAENLAEHLRNNPDLPLEDAAYTLQVGRRAFPFRRAVVASDVPEAIAELCRHDLPISQRRSHIKENPVVCFLFPGQGSQHPNMGHEIYRTERVFRDSVDRCAEILLPNLGVDLRTLLYPGNGSSREEGGQVSDGAAVDTVVDTIIAQPAIFTIEYALAQLWMSWGIRPQAMLGHSIGEFVAACLAGVFSVEDALGLVAARGRMMQDVPPGGMLAVRLPESEVRRRLHGHLSLAAVNAPSLCVVAGPFDALESFEQQLAHEGTSCRRLNTSHAFHSAMMDPVIEPFTERVARVRLQAPRIPYLSGVTGRWITEKETTDPAYWARHFREAVQFSAGVIELRRNANNVLLEVGPGNVLNALARQHAGAASQNGSDAVIVSTLADGYSGEGDAASLMKALGSLWMAGVQPDWAALYGEERRHRISLPTYPFERKRYWLELPVADQPIGAALPAATNDLAKHPASDAEISVAKSPVIEIAVVEHAPMEETQQVTPLQNTVVQNPALTWAPANSVPNRIARIRTMLAEVFEELSGMELSQADGSTSFLEMGFDSLFLTQVSQVLQNKVGLKITFRQLLGDQSTLDALAEYLESKLPADVLSEIVPASSPMVAFPEAAPVAFSAPALIAADQADVAERESASGSAVERLMREQLQAMNQLFSKQMETLRGATPASSAEVSAPVPLVSSVSSAVSPAPSPRTVPAGVSAVLALTNGASAGAAAKEEFKPFGPYKPPQKGTSGELTERHTKYLKELIERYTKRTAKSKSMTQEYRLALADPRVVSGFRSQWKEMVYPITTTRSKGSLLWDVDGNEYVDILNGFGPIMLGHRPEFVEKAIEKQLHEGFETGPQTPLAGEVARMFCDMTGNERMTFCNTGSEAVMAALRVARTVTGRNKVALFSGAYHGMFDEVLVKGFKKGGVPQSVPVAPGIPREKVANILVLDYGTPEALELIRQNAKDLAAVLVEPVQSRHPHLQPVEFLKELRKITQESGTALVFDEVVTGFRVHPGGCQSMFGIRADLATYGKVIAGGMPIGVLAGKAEFMDALDGGTWQFGDDSYPEVGVTFFAGTFVRHPLTLAAIKAVLCHFQEQGPALQERLTERTTQMVRAINDIFEHRSIPTRIESFGSIFYFGFPSEERFASLFYYYLREKGIHILEGFPCFLTTTHSDADIARIIRAFQESAMEMQEAGFFSEPDGLPPTGSAKVELGTAPPARSAPMTESQREIFLAAHLGDEASCSFNESFSLHLRGPLEADVLRDAVGTIVARHEALRSAVDVDGATLYFVPKLDLAIPLIDLSSAEPAVRDAERKRILAEDARTPFALGTGPLVRAVLLRLDADDHVLLFTSHHMVCDGWSTNVLLDELAQIYNAKTQGRTPELPAAIAFGEYAQARVAETVSPENTEVESYWLSQFKDVPVPLDLPLDRPRPAVKGYAGATFRTKIGPETYRKIKQLGSKKGCTLFVTLLAGFQALLHRLSLQNDIVVGIPAAGQSLIEGSLVGHCVNFLPLRARFHEDLSFSGLLAGVKKTVLDAYDHQAYTYGTLVRKLAIARDPSRLPLMEVQFNLERIGSGANFRGLEADVEPNPKGAVNFDIFFNVVESDRGLMIDCDYNTDLFDESTIARWLQHFETLLLAAVIDADGRVDDLPLMTSAQVTALLSAWNRHPQEYAVDSSMAQAFEQQVARMPEGVAVAMGDDRITYRELNERSNQLARALRKGGVKPGTFVAMCFERSLEMIVSFLAALKAGGAYLPIDSSYPRERLTMILDDAQPAVLLTQERLLASLPEHRAHTICVDKEWPSITAESRENLPPIAKPDDLAYLIYTSGSTGKPKGVMVTHRNVVRLFASTQPWFHFNEHDVWSLFHTYSFDVSAWEIWGCLLSGGCLLVVPFWVTRSPQEFHALLAKEKVTVLCQTPVAFYQLIQVEESGASENLALRYAILAGEALNFAKLRPWLKRHGDQKPEIINMYGPTEATIYSTYRRLSATDIAQETRSLIGVPVPDVSIYLLDAKMKPVPPGVAGDMYLGGAGVARGYWNRPELNAECFVADPFAGRPGARMYKTGDVARFLWNGDLDFLGRKDSQVKIHGFRIELGEIEATLAQHPDVQQVTVDARKNVAGEGKLAAYFVSRSGNKVSGAELREFLEAKIPAHMVPYAYVQLESLPLNPNGKVDRAKLPAPHPSEAAREREYVAPRTPQEKLLAGILQEVLQVERVGVTDNLFELGADSLHVFQITSRAAKAGLTITPRLLLQRRSISGVLAESGSADVAVRPSSPVLTVVPRKKYRVSQETAEQVGTKE